ncbi:MAG: hypothetical protein EPN72_13875 [Nevskiaceae bacterium]|nr:MAG: hypothetical protein EPN63_14205 [Nevskiaceae bacterium]TBR71547.1 MAG: hypothetical protein EPN72_13875 [Nevskiaceae bacterium]
MPSFAFRVALVAVVCAIPLAVLQADTLQMAAAPGPPLVTAPSAAITTPVRGSTMAAVESRFGVPAQRHAPVGGESPSHPPITRWDYPTFSVFFEHGHVIDSVIPGNPPPVYHTSQLQASP